MIKTAKIRNIEVYSFSSRDIFLRFIENKQKILIAINAEKILKNDEKLEKIINSNIGYPDGIGAVMALKQKGLDAIKIPGAEFWLDFVEKFYRQKSFYLVGGTTDVIEKTVHKLKQDYQGIKITGYRNGFLNDLEKGMLIRDLQNKKPDVVFVAQGSPRQEYLMDELIKKHPALYMGLGGSFDVFCGLKKRAPIFFLNLNLEWLYRLIKEPTRISRQVVLLKYYLLLKLNKL